MTHHRSRRSLLADVGRGTLLATDGSSLAMDLKLVPRAFAADAEEQHGALTFGGLEPLVRALQEPVPFVGRIVRCASTG